MAYPRSNDSLYNAIRIRTTAETERQIEQLTDFLDHLAEPTRYYSKSWFDRWVANAEKVVSRLPIAVMNQADSKVCILIDKVKRIQNMISNAEFHRKSANDRFVQRELHRLKSFFDSVEAKPLTQEQRVAIVNDEDNNLVVAAAGSGKTSVIAGKFKWLVTQGYRNWDEILMLVFANEAAEEMKNRVSNSISCDAKNATNVFTFHSFGRDIVGKVEGKMPSVASFAKDAINLRSHIKKIIEELMKRPGFAQIVTKWFQEYFAPRKSVFEFETKGDYVRYLKQYNIRGLKGEIVRSFEECEIANYLYLNGVEYEYERKYEKPTADKNRGQYCPDFYLPEAKLYIEHLALTQDGQTPSFMNCERYIDDLEWKRELHREHGTKMLETYSWWGTLGILTANLERMLRKEGVKMRKIPSEQMFDRLNELHQIDPFTDRVAEFLKHFKEMGLSEADLNDKIEQQYDERRNKAFAEVFMPIYREYEHRLKESGDIDFDDMISLATRYVKDGRYKSPYRHILVDEFQDISIGRARLLAALLNSNSEDGIRRSRLFAVGDDWQSIYRFAGSDVSSMWRFSSEFGVTKRTNLTRTFRCSKNITNISKRFVMKNTNQIEKDVHTCEKGPDGNVYVYFPKGSRRKPVIDRVLEKTDKHGRELNRKQSVLLLGRYRNQCPENLGELKHRFPRINIGFNTVHASKGREADIVIVLDMKGGYMGFPSDRQTDPILNLVLPFSESFPNAEERRLLYVAMTRARRSVYLLSGTESRSEFLEELVSEEYGVLEFGHNVSQDVRCRICNTGVMVRRGSSENNSNGFYGCSNYPRCDNRESVCSTCSKGLPVIENDGLVCSNCKKQYTSCPRKGCVGWKINRRSEFGLFVGCSKYPECEFKQNIASTGSDGDSINTKEGEPFIDVPSRKIV